MEDTIKVVKGKNAKVKWIKDILNFEKNTFESKYWGTYRKYKGWYYKNKDIYTFLIDTSKDKAVGYTMSIPLKYEAYEKIRKGTKIDTLYLQEEHIVPINEVYKQVYIYAMIIDEKYRKKKYGDKLLFNMYETITENNSASVYVLAEAISEEGEKILIRNNYQKILETPKRSKMFEIKYKNS